MISRYPMLESQTPSNQRFVRSVLEVQGQRVVVYSFHATIPLFEIRRTYNDDALSTNIRDMVSLIQHEVDPVILMCDCNSTPRTAQYAWLDAVLDDAHRARGRGFGLTFPANGDLASMPLIRIDYIWYSDHFTALDAKVGDDSGGSDHFPLWARLVLRG
jgi:endonuclease/exonuclease/phosphatase (EEP) superfamily protein YafD